MSCEELSEELSAYIDGELSSAERVRLEEHLAECPRCREGLEALRAVSGLVASLPAVSASARLTEALQETLAKPPRRSRLRPIPLSASDLLPVLAAAAVALIAVTMTFVLPHFTAPVPKVGPGVAYEESPAPVEGTDYEAIPRVAAPPEAPAAAAVTEGVVSEDRAARGPSDELSAEFTRRAAKVVPAKEAAEVRTPSPAQAKGADTRSEALTHLRFAAPAERDSAVSQTLPESTDSNMRVGESVRLKGAHVPEAGRKVVAGNAGAEPAAEELTRRPYYTVTYYCSEPVDGRRSFNLALSEFEALSAQIAGPAVVRPMTKKEAREYARLVHDLSQSTDVVILKDMMVPASDLALVRAVFSDRAELSPEQAPEDRAELQRQLASARARLASRKAEEEPTRGLGLGGTAARARTEYDRQISQRPAQELVHVLLVLKQRKETGETAP